MPELFDPLPENNLNESRRTSQPIDRMPLGYIEWNADFRVQQWNAAAERIFGWSTDEAKGRHAYELMVPVDAQPAVNASWQKTLQSEEPIFSVNDNVNKNGARFSCEWQNIPLRDGSGKILGMLTLVNPAPWNPPSSAGGGKRSPANSASSQAREVALLKGATDWGSTVPAGPIQTERELRESRKFLQTIIDTEPECVKLIAADGALIMMNPAGLAMIEVDSLEQVKGGSVYRLIAPEHLDAFKKITEDVFQGKEGNLTFEMIGNKGRRLWLDTHAVPLRNDKDEIVALLGITRDVTERKKTEEALKQEKNFSDTIINSLPGMFYICDEEGSLIKWNNNDEKKVTGYGPEELGGKNVLTLFGADRELVASAMRDVFIRGKAEVEARLVSKNGAIIPFLLTGCRMITEGKRYLVGMGIDISARKRLEEQLRQSHKMESIGALAGGIAHDFNNILTAIIGYGTLLQMKLKDNESLSHSVEQILLSAKRAASLTQSLLAYSGKHIMNPQPISLNELIKKVERLLTMLLGEDIEFKTLLSESGVLVLADAGQIEQVLMNLAVNAREAMPDGGNLFLETSQLDLDESSAKAHGLNKSGHYVLVTFTDSGEGMDDSTRERIFEPVFSTSGDSRGTGLGLAMAYSIIKQHGGSIEVSSEGGRGTVFTIYLPAVQGDAGESRSTALPPIVGGVETVLVAEDDQTVRKLTCSVLEQFGYSVIQAIDGEDAVNKFMENRDAVRLLILDVLMPKKNGKEVYTKIRIFRPDIKALFVSGYTSDVMQKQGLIDQGIQFMLKPVLMNDLLRKVREILDG